MLLPGIVDILADSELVFLAISSERLITFETFIPAAGSNSLRVTTSPNRTYKGIPTMSSCQQAIVVQTRMLLEEAFVAQFPYLHSKLQ